MMGVQDTADDGAAAGPPVRARLRPPEPPTHHVRRARLHDLLDDEVVAPLTLVVAPAGAGKTALLAGWAAESERPVAWLALDEGDRDAVRLWRDVLAAVDALSPGAGEGAEAVLQGPATVGEAVDRLIDDLGDRDAPPSVLVLDDAHLVDADALVMDSLARFLRHLPPWLRAVVASRRALPLPLDRLRARGQLGEIHFTELRFTPDEAGDLLARLAPALVPDDVAATVARADGWAASLQLAALAARAAVARDEVPGPADGADPLVRDYVVREVLAAEPRALVETMLDLAVVERVNPSLARALTGRADAGGLLRQAEERGLFVTRVPAAGWFEIHSLVRAALVAELADQVPDRLAQRHARAARWYAEAGETAPALDHWLAADEPRAALRLLAAEHAALYDEGREAVVHRTLAALPPAVANTDLTAMLEYTWCHLLVDRHRFLALVDKLVWWADRPGTDRAIRPRVAMLLAIAATVGGRWVEGGMLAAQAMIAMGDGWWRDPLGRFGWNMVARKVALTEQWDERTGEVREAEMALSRDPERRLTFEGTRALGEALAGRPVDALRVAAGVRAAAAVTHMTILRHELAVAEAVAHREIGERDRAIAELRAIVDAPGAIMVFCQAVAAAQLVEALLDTGDVAAARAELCRLEVMVDTEALGADARSWMARAGTQVALAEGSVGEARRWADQVDDPFWTGVCGARVDLAQGSRADAAAALDGVEPRCGRHEVVRALLRAQASADRDEAVRWMTVAVERAAAQGLLQTVAAEGPDVVALVEHAAWRAPTEWTDRLRRAAVAGGQAQVPAGDPVGTLTARERDVLRLLAGRLTVREIANELYVSPNTLKFHLKTIYRKLDVGSRAEAAAIARRMVQVEPQRQTG